jgi:hypothetical protein
MYIEVIEPVHPAAGTIGSRRIRLGVSGRIPLLHKITDIERAMLVGNQVNGRFHENQILDVYLPLQQTEGIEIYSERPDADRRFTVVSPDYIFEGNAGDERTADRSDHQLAVQMFRRLLFRDLPHPFFKQTGLGHPGENCDQE